MFQREDWTLFRSVATLAFDCRRTDMFQAQLIDALNIVDRGDLTPTEMRGDWAGDFGQTQFLPSAYYKYAVDFDGDGRLAIPDGPGLGVEIDPDKLNHFCPERIVFR